MTPWKEIHVSRRLRRKGLGYGVRNLLPSFQNPKFWSLRQTWILIACRFITLEASRRVRNLPPRFQPSRLSSWRHKLLFIGSFQFFLEASGQRADVLLRGQLLVSLESATQVSLSGPRELHWILPGHGFLLRRPRYRDSIALPFPHGCRITTDLQA